MQLELISDGVAIFSFPNGTKIIADAEDVERITQYHWNLDKTSRGKPYVRCRSGVFRATLQRFLIDAPDGVLVRHINGDDLDFRKANLSLMEYTEQAKTRRHTRASVTGYQNVAIAKGSDGKQRYLVSVTTNGIKKTKTFAYTPEKLQEAVALAERWREDITYEPPRRYQQRMRHDDNHLPPPREDAIHLTRIAPYHMPRGTWRMEADGAYLMLKERVEAIVSRSDVEMVAQHRWYAKPNSVGGYYAATTIDDKTVQMHRLIMRARFDQYVDHINHDTLDNRRENLRLTTKTQNDANRAGAYMTSKTGIRGVSIHTYKNGRHAYVFRCHIKTCPVAKYFEYSECGLDDARKYSEAHYEAMAARLF